METYIKEAILRIGARRVAEVLGISRTGVLSIAAGVARQGTIALATINKPRLDDELGRAPRDHVAA